MPTHAPVHVLDDYYLAITLLITVAYQLIGFSIAFTFKFDKITDFMGGSNFALLAIITLAMSGSTDARQIITSVMLMLWAVRLSGFLLFRILKTGKDDRFDDKRDKFWSFLGFWVFQMLWVWTVSLPVTILNSPNVLRVRQPSFGRATDIIAIIIFVLAFGLEAISDAQKYRFKQGPGKEPGAVCDVGFFKYSRHPNYFAEIMTQVCKSCLAVLNFKKTLTDNTLSYLHHRCHTCQLRRSFIQQRRLRCIVRQLRRLHSSDQPSPIPIWSASPRAPWCEEALREGRWLACLREVSARYQHSHPHASSNLEKFASYCQAYCRLRVANVCLRPGEACRPEQGAEPRG